MIRAWRNWCVAKFNNLQNCVTTNVYWGVEINAHALINYIVYCRDTGATFNTTLLQSQACEGTFRDARAFSSTESTVVNFTMQGFESRLNKIQFKRNVMHRNQHSLNFPSLSKKADSNGIEMPTNEEIIEAVEQSRAAVHETLVDLGIDASQISFESSVTTKHLKEKPSQTSDDFVFITVSAEFEALEKENFDPDVHDADELFHNIGEEIMLKDSQNYKNVFKIKNRQNKIVHVKKRTFLWMLTSGLQKCSTDRNYHFIDKQDKSDNPKYVNEIYENIVVGEYVLLKEDSVLTVFKVYGFKYLKGKNCAYSASIAPVRPPNNVEPRGIGLQGCTFDIIECDGEYVLDLASINVIKDIKYYMSHLLKPTVLSALLYYCEDCVTHIKKFK